MGKCSFSIWSSRIDCLFADLRKTRLTLDQNAINAKLYLTSSVQKASKIVLRNLSKFRQLEEICISRAASRQILSKSKILSPAKSLSLQRIMIELNFDFSELFIHALKGLQDSNSRAWTISESLTGTHTEISRTKTIIAVGTF